MLGGRKPKGERHVQVHATEREGDGGAHIGSRGNKRMTRAGQS